ncbi:MAG: tRNA (adenosine(37)-N6)-threonylcarbamoyltransferase complex transferase subunit TsaD [Deltaproteobacteria bacterium]|nr:tRNA (adenosine(37)-N6)-threonylcarbamoyltransferase complex transferase subunit TsaD [Deltaproteobacteria bacterium]
MVILGVETSCDETAAAVVRDGRILLSNVIASQVDVHARYGGVVPEIASRKHIEAIAPVIQQALRDAGVTLGEIEGVAVTRGPGLIGSLLVGLSAAKALSYARRLPLVGVNHLEGHVAAIFLTDSSPPAFPFIALVVSGGHTTIYRVEDFHRFVILGQTRDDAAGEAFDKAAKLMEIGYPGGVVIDRLAQTGDCSAVAFPRAMKDCLDFSFSGLKTSLLMRLRKKGTPFSTEELPDLAASYQEAIVDVLVEKTLRSALESSIPRIVLCGGVAANTRLRSRFREETARFAIDFFVPPPVLCTDNAGMIAVVGEHLFREGRRDGLNLNAVSRWPISR